MLIGVRDAAEQVGERREETRAIRLEVIERLERLAQRGELRLGRPVDAQPGANRLEGHVQEYPGRRAMLRFTGTSVEGELSHG